MNTAVLTIGNELLTGATVNTNASWLGRRLFAAGFPVRESVAVRDQQPAIEGALRYLWENHDLILLTGGLGPTHDDVTLSAVSEFFGSPLRFHEPTFDAISEQLTARDIPVTEGHRKQAMLPELADIIPNPAGTAPALRFSTGGKYIYALPGVPHEMREVFSVRVLPEIRKLGANKFTSYLFRTVGLPESEVYNEVEELVERLPEETVAFLPGEYGVDVRLLFPGEDLSGLEKEVVEGIRKRLAGAIYSEADESLAAVVGERLRTGGLSLSTAESCTGGLLADAITDIPGSSDYFMAGFVTYSNQSKEQTLGVPGGLIREYGAVSAQVAEAMAAGALEAANTETAVSTTGIAGPTGGTQEKPVGLVYVGCAARDTVISQRFRFTGQRRLNKERTVAAALNLLRTQI